MARKRQSYTYVYEETRHSRRGVLATILGGISLIAFFVLMGICAMLQGNGGPWAGSIGITAFVMAFAGMVYGLKSFRDQCKYTIFCKIGTLLCGFMVAVWFLIFCVGLAS